VSDPAGPVIVPPAPAPAMAAAFGARLATAARYVDLLLTAGVQRGLIGPREHDRIWDRHLGNSAALAELIPAGATVVDIGSGAGLPGIPLALLRPDLAIELLEPMQRRVDFLIECVAVLDLGHVTVRRGRAPEDLRPDRGGIAVARAVAPLTKLIGATRPVLDTGGTLLALKGRSAATEMDTVRQQQLPVRLELLRPSFADQSVTVVRVRHDTPRRTIPTAPHR
jgi:16S rRNA (guanine527-N7)-methyltransferase